MCHRFLLYLSLLALLLPSFGGKAQATFDSLQLIQSTSIYFDFNQYDIRPDADSILQAFLNELPTDKKNQLHITAHTDSIGSIKRNLELSGQRAQSVKDTLIAMGINDSLIQITNFGEAKPAAENRTEEGRQQNRRATIQAFEPIKMQYVTGKVTDPTTGKGISAKVMVTSKTTKDSTQTDSSGYFKAIAPAKSVVGIDVFAEGYFYETLMKRLKGNETTDIKLKPIEEGAAIDLKNFYFVGNQAVLLKRSEPELPKLLKFMQANPNIKIEIAGHVNQPNRPPVLKSSFSYQLSVARAKTIHDYLIENGIEENGMTFAGYGNWEMRYPNARSQEEQALNRRVEIKVLSKN